MFYINKCTLLLYNCVLTQVNELLDSLATERYADNRYIMEMQRQTISPDFVIIPCLNKLPVWK